MADGTFHITLSPATSYATRNNIKFPGPTGSDTAQEAKADSRIEDSLPTGVTVAGLDIVVSGEA